MDGRRSPAACAPADGLCSEATMSSGASASGLSVCRQLPSKKAPDSTENASCRMFPSTWQVEQSCTLRARMLPSTRPRTIASSANTSPTMTAFSPMTSEAARISPSTLPSIVTSPAETSVPRTINSALMTEGTPPLRVARLAGAAGGGVTAASGSLVFENIVACLDELARISHRIVVPHFIVNMRSGAAPRRSEFADDRALFDGGSNLHQYLGQMTVSRPDTITMINFHGVSVGALRPGEDDNA